MRHLLALIVVALLASACDRPLVGEGGGSSFLAVEPDLSVVRLDPDLTLRLRTSGLEGALSVTVNGTPASFDSLEDVFVLPTTLDEGLNFLFVELTDDAGFTRRDTLVAVHLPLEPVSLIAPRTGVPRVDAAASVLPDGRILVTGGVGQGGRALETATILRAGGVQVDSREIGLGTARAGHTASVLPDGRVLLLGGALTDRPTTQGEFVHTVEVIDADGTSATQIEADAPPTRAGHTAQVLTLDGETYIYLYGGLVPAGTGTTVSGTVDVYRLGGEGTEEGGAVADLTRLSPEGGAGSFARVTRHTQVALNQREAIALGRADGEPVGLAFLWRTPGTASFPFELLSGALPEAVGGRAGAAAVEVGTFMGAPGLVLVVGGETNIGPTGSMEVIAPGLGRAFRIPGVSLQVPREGHTATILSNRRIVVFGGRSASGAALSTIEAFEF